MMKRKVLVPLICLFGVVLGLTLASLGYYRDERFVKLEPGRIELIRQTLLEGQKVDVNLVFQNGSSEKFIVERVHTSCSCTDILTDDRQRLSAGYEILPGKKLPLKATIDLTGRTGPQKFYLTIRGKVGDRSVSRESTIHAHVYPGWSVVPSPIVLDDLEPGKMIEKEFPFLDGTPGSDVPLPSVVSSAPELLTAEVVRQVGRTTEQLTKNVAAERQVHVLRVRIVTPSDFGIRTRALLNFSSEYFPERDLTLPVTFRTLSAPYTFTPDSIYLSGLSAGQTWTRDVDCEIREDQDSGLEVLQCPTGINASIVDVGMSRKRLKLSGTVPQSQGHAVSVVLGIEGRVVNASLPIHYGTSSSPVVTRP